MGRRASRAAPTKNVQPCPVCGSRNSVRIVYGQPSQATMEALRAGRVVLGGCHASPDGPAWHCRDCKAEWPRDT